MQNWTNIQSMAPDPADPRARATLLLPAALHQRLKLEAARSRRSMCAIAAAAIERELRRLESRRAA